MGLMSDLMLDCKSRRAWVSQTPTKQKTPQCSSWGLLMAVTEFNPLQI